MALERDLKRAPNTLYRASEDSPSASLGTVIGPKILYLRTLSVYDFVYDFAYRSKSFAG